MASPFQTRRVALALALGILVATSAAYFGYEVGVETQRRETLLCSSIHTENYLSTLRGLRTGDTAAALRMLETSVDVGTLLMGTGPAAPDEKAAQAVNKTLIAVKDYRHEHPWVGGNPETNARVANVLAQTQSKP